MSYVATYQKCYISTKYSKRVATYTIITLLKITIADRIQNGVLLNVFAF